MTDLTWQEAQARMWPLDDEERADAYAFAKHIATDRSGIVHRNRALGQVIVEQAVELERLRALIASEAPF